MIKINRKKRLEEKYFYEVKNLYPNFPDGEVIPSESPDFLINCHNKIIGIELTRYYKKQDNNTINDRNIEDYEWEICKRGLKFFQKINKSHVAVQSSWNIKNKLQNKKINTLAQALAEVVNKSIFESNDNHISLNSRHLRNTPLEGYCRSIYIQKSIKISFWAPIRAAFIGLAVKQIQETISKKEPNLNRYLSKCEEIWLIIVCEGYHLSSMVSIDDDDETLLFSYKTNFDCLLLYDKEHARVYPLRTSKDQRFILSRGPLLDHT